MIGARIRQGDGSLIQIDPSWECLGMKQAGITVSAPSYTVPGSGGSTIGRVTISSGGCNEPILAIFCSTAFVGVMSKSQSGTTYTWDIVTDIPGASFTYWIFDTTDVAQIQFLTTKGLRIRNPSNNRVIFDSRYKYMRIQQIVSVNSGTSSIDVPISMTGNYAVGISNAGLYTAVTGGPVGGGPSWIVNTAGFVTGFRTNTNGTISVMLIRLRLSITDGQNPPYPPTGLMGDNKLTGMILDMRNY